MKHTLFDIALFFFAIVLGIEFFQFLRGNSELKAKIESQAMQANILIDEIGQTKEENQKIHEKLLEAEGDVFKLQETVEILERELEAEETEEAEEAKIIPAAEPVPPPKVRRIQELQAPPDTRNFLIIGHNHRLADTILLAFVSEQTRKITLVSIPRDLFVNGRKINEYLVRYGPEVLQKKVEDVTGLPMHGFIVIDFKAFENIVDALGGIDVSVEKSIYDPLYPNGNGSYMVFSIEAGLHHLNGAEALKYARSRHSTSDFDRAKRQQQILDALRVSLLNIDFINGFDELKKIYNTLRDSINMDVEFSDAIHMLQNYREYEIMSGNVLSTQNFLYSTTNIAGQYILLPKSGSFNKIQKFLRDLLN